MAVHERPQLLAGHGSQPQAGAGGGGVLVVRIPLVGVVRERRQHLDLGVRRRLGQEALPHLPAAGREAVGDQGEPVVVGQEPGRRPDAGQGGGQERLQRRPDPDDGAVRLVADLRPRGAVDALGVVLGHALERPHQLGDGALLLGPADGGQCAHRGILVLAQAGQVLLEVDEHLDEGAPLLALTRVGRVEPVQPVADLREDGRAGVVRPGQHEPRHHGVQRLQVDAAVGSRHPGHEYVEDLGGQGHQLQAGVVDEGVAQLPQRLPHVVPRRGGALVEELAGPLRRPLVDGAAGQVLLAAPQEEADIAHEDAQVLGDVGEGLVPGALGPPLGEDRQDVAQRRRRGRVRRALAEEARLQDVDGLGHRVRVLALKGLERGDRPLRGAAGVEQMGPVGRLKNVARGHTARLSNRDVPAWRSEGTGAARRGSADRSRGRDRFARTGWGRAERPARNTISRRRPLPRGRRSGRDRAVIRRMRVLRRPRVSLPPAPRVVSTGFA